MELPGIEPCVAFSGLDGVKSRSPTAASRDVVNQDLERDQPAGATAEAITATRSHARCSPSPAANAVVKAVSTVSAISFPGSAG